MSNAGLWILDPDTGEERFILYSELEADVRASLIKPIGGFCFPVDLFLASNLPNVPFYLKDWLPKRGKAILYAPPKSGKSYLCAQLARCLGSGEDFLGIPTVESKVLYVQFELGEEILRARLLGTGKEYPNVFVGTTFSMKLDTEIGQKYLRTAMDAVEPNVLILDPKIKFLAGDENESGEMRPVCDFLDALIEGYKCSVFITDHTGKDLSKRGRGSSIWEGWVDSYLQMQAINKKGEPLHIKISPVFLRHAALPPNSIEAVMSDKFEFELVATDGTVQQQVLDFIKKNGMTKPSQLFIAKIGSNTSVYESLKRLEKEGKIKKQGRGEYVAT